MNNVFFGSFVEAGLHAQRLPTPNFSKQNRSIKKIFVKNGMEVKKFTLKGFFKDMIV